MQTNCVCEFLIFSSLVLFRRALTIQGLFSQKQLGAYLFEYSGNVNRQRSLSEIHSISLFLVSQKIELPLKRTFFCSHESHWGDRIILHVMKLVFLLLPPFPSSLIDISPTSQRE